MYRLSNMLDTIVWHTIPIVRKSIGGHRDLLVREVMKNCNIRHNLFTNRLINPRNYPNEIVEVNYIKLDKFMVTNIFEGVMKLDNLKLQDWYLLCIYIYTTLMNEIGVTVW